MWPKEINEVWTMLAMRTNISPPAFYRLVIKEYRRLVYEGQIQSGTTNVEERRRWADAIKERVTEEYLNGDWIDADDVDKMHYYLSGEVIRKRPELRRVK